MDAKPRDAAPLRWTPRDLHEALRRAHAGDRTVALKEAGILDENGEISERYKSWGDKVSMTEVGDSFSERAGTKPSSA